MKHQKDFYAVLVQSDNQVIVRQLLEEHVPPAIKAKILAEYNKQALYRRRAKAQLT